MSTSTRKLVRGAFVLATVFAALITTTRWAHASSGYSGPINVGTSMTSEDEKLFEGLSVMADGRGLPPGKGTHAQGRQVYMEMCASCHGEKMEGNPQMGPASWFALRGGRGTLASGKALTTVESYWPYATTIFDYVYRAMPLNAPGSLTHDQVYAVTAYMLGEMGIIDKSTVIDAKTLPQIKMPNRDGFIPDNRPDIRIYR
jgi:cytochrome c